MMINKEMAMFIMATLDLKNRTKKKRKAKSSNIAIRKWMKANYVDHIDPLTNEINATSLVEAWDHACADGSQTLDPNHIAWDIAVDVIDSI